MNKKNNEQEKESFVRSGQSSNQFDNFVSKLEEIKNDKRIDMHFLYFLAFIICLIGATLGFILGLVYF